MCALWTSVETEEEAEIVRRLYLPRHLSDSDDSIHPDILKMYAWCDPPPPEDINSSSSNSLDEDGKPRPLANSFTDSVLEACTSISSISLDDATEAGTAGPASTSSDYDSDCLNFELDCDPNGVEISLEPGTPTITDKIPLLGAEKLTLDLNGRTPRDSSWMQNIKSPLYQENEFTFYQPKRSSSLKTKRTPPGTPGRKMVRFADAFGLDLETVRHIFNQESPPKIPASATKDLHLETDESFADQGAKFFTPCFAQPGCSGNFIRRVLQQTVCLENILIEKSVMTGTVRIKSLGFEKAIFLRITFNNWATFADIAANYVQDSHDGVTDRFSFSVVFPSSLVVGSKAQFALRYETQSGDVFWDNNFGHNYVIECFAKNSGVNSDSWMHFI